MKTHLQMTVQLVRLVELGVLALVAAAILTRYPGLIDMGVKLPGGGGHITIDGRTIEQPDLSPALRDRR